MREKKQCPLPVPVSGLRGVGRQMAKHLARLDIFSVDDLLFHLPARYQDRTRIEPIRGLLPDREAVVEGVIKAVSLKASGRTRLLCQLSDGAGTIALRFFHVPGFLQDTLKVGTRLRCYSTVKLGREGLQMVHPEFQVIREGVPLPMHQHLTPIYPATEGLSQHMLRKLAQNALDIMHEHMGFAEILPVTLLQSLAFPEFRTALEFVHRPPRSADMALLAASKTPAQKRLVFEELLAHRLSLLRVKQELQAQGATPLLKESRLVQQFLDTLPFQLTKAQARVFEEVRCDLARSFPMLRLVQGDVGSGKTVIAALAMLQAVESGCQAALMAPTELLAEQHYRVFSRWFAPLGIPVVLLTGSIKARARQSAFDAIANGEAKIILGTHALFQEDVNFAALALVVTDEQHRFGVHQRALFREKGMQTGDSPHQMIMTATPIPRTLAMSFYADLDCSVIDELPPGRTAVTTSVMAGARREEVIARIREACQTGRQVYWVCPLIDESELLPSQAATSTAEDLKVLLPELQIGLIHGRLGAEAKARAMQAFVQGDTHVLVATTVIEVGVDVPNASVMIIENAERLGLSQLHQLRGRVGRGSTASHCLLLYQQPLSLLAQERLSVMRETTDGFRIAKRDLELRGPGEVLGTRQTGELSFRMADLLRDSELLHDVHQAAERIMRDHADSIEPLIARWIRKKGEYAKV